MGRLLLGELSRSRLLCHDTQQLAEACLLQHFPPTYRVLGCLGWHRMAPLDMATGIETDQ